MHGILGLTRTHRPRVQRIKQDRDGCVVFIILKRLLECCGRTGAKADVTTVRRAARIE
jgi:hypothetical protein